MFKKTDHPNRKVRDRVPARNASTDSSTPPLRLVRSDRACEYSGQRTEGKKDRVLEAAVTGDIVRADEIASLTERHINLHNSISWRDVALLKPELADSLREIAASLYGFRSLLICEVGTLVYNDLLTTVLSETDWQRLFEEHTVPVVEYGCEPGLTRRHVMGSPDPGAPAVRRMLKELTLHSFELVYIPRTQLTDLQRLLISRIPQIGVAALTSARTNIRVLTESETFDLIDNPVRRAA